MNHDIRALALFIYSLSFRNYLRQHCVSSALHFIVYLAETAIETIVSTICEMETKNDIFVPRYLWTQIVHRIFAHAQRRCII